MDFGGRTNARSSDGSLPASKLPRRSSESTAITLARMQTEQQQQQQQLQQQQQQQLQAALASRGLSQNDLFNNQYQNQSSLSSQSLDRQGGGNNNHVFSPSQEFGRNMRSVQDLQQGSPGMALQQLQQHQGKEDDVLASLFGENRVSSPALQMNHRIGALQQQIKRNRLAAFNQVQSAGSPHGNNPQIHLTPQQQLILQSGAQSAVANALLMRRDSPSGNAGGNSVSSPSLQQEIFQQRQRQQALQQLQQLQQKQQQEQEQEQKQQVQQQDQERQTESMGLPPSASVNLSQGTKTATSLLQELPKNSNTLEPLPLGRPPDGNACAQRLMQFMYHQRRRPAVQESHYLVYQFVIYVSACWDFRIITLNFGGNLWQNISVQEPKKGFVSLLTQTMEGSLQEFFLRCFYLESESVMPFLPPFSNLFR